MTTTTSKTTPRGDDGFSRPAPSRCRYCTGLLHTGTPCGVRQVAWPEDPRLADLSDDSPQHEGEV
jgi:hypothetical protein